MYSRCTLCTKISIYMTYFAGKPESSTYREVRGLSRGLAVLRALNALPGGIGGVVELARLTGLHRTTVKRLLETLKVEGLVHQEDDGALYVLSFEVRRLSEGYVGADWIDRVASPAMRAHLHAMSWPSDLATPSDNFMIVRESTHRVSLLSQHRAMIGTRIAMLTSALGRAWLTWAEKDERNATLALLRQRQDAIGAIARDKTFVQRLLRETKRRGYAINRGELVHEESVIAIACPILIDQHAVGAINLVLQKNAVSEREMITRYVPLLQVLAAEISEGASQLPRG